MVQMIVKPALVAYAATRSLGWYEYTCVELRDVTETSIALVEFNIRDCLLRTLIVKFWNSSSREAIAVFGEVRSRLARSWY